jgi:hypothetical protein
MEEEQKQSEPAAKFDWVKSKQGTPEIYGNYLHVSWTLFDVRLLVGQLIPSGPNLTAAFFAEERVAVTLAWPEVKILRDMVADLVAKYEKVNGEIKPLTLPPNTPTEAIATEP